MIEELKAKKAKQLAFDKKRKQYLLDIIIDAIKEWITNKEIAEILNIHPTNLSQFKKGNLLISPEKVESYLQLLTNEK